MRSSWTGAAAVLLIFVALGLLLPAWLVFLLAVALAKGLVVLGAVILMRAGLVSFGQALFYAAGAYAVAFGMSRWGISDALTLLLLGGAAGLVAGAVTGLLVARYRQIFFAMLTLAFSMALYGALVKAYAVTGGSDGLRVAAPTVLGLDPFPQSERIAVYWLALAAVAVAAYLIDRYFRSPLGYLVQAIRDNEVRVQYLRGSVPRAIFAIFVLAGLLAGVGGALESLSVGHVDPQLAYWTTSGEFVFIAVLSGTGSVYAPLGGTILFELIKAYAFKYAPYTWQMVLGAAMLAVVLLLPGGLWTLWERRAGSTADSGAAGGGPKGVRP